MFITSAISTGSAPRYQTGPCRNIKRRSVRTLAARRKCCQRKSATPCGRRKNQNMPNVADRWTITARVAMDHLEAVGCPRFDIGVKRPDGKMLLRERWSSGQVLKSLLWLRRENFHSGHIYIRPSGFHSLSLADDLAANAVAKM